MRITFRLLFIVVALGLVPRVLGADESAQATVADSLTPAFSDLQCGYASPATRRAQRQAAILRGQIADPRVRPLSPVGAVPPPIRGFPNGEACLSTAHLFPYEDSAQLLTGTYAYAELEQLMTEAANALIAARGDRYDFIGFWTSFAPAALYGIAFYNPIFNDIEGIGDPSTEGTPLFDARPAVGLVSQRVAGYVMMNYVNWWDPSPGQAGLYTRLALTHEIEHRWAAFLPPLLGGQQLQGGVGECGREFHWNWKIDGQGSAMEISDWIGRDPARLDRSALDFNRDIGGVFSFTDLYVMGYVSPEEMDAGNSELRFMEQSDCSTEYFGPILDWTSADIIASAGPRVPAAASAQKHFRMGWVMLHQPGNPPTSTDRLRAISILARNQADWYFGALRRGTINHQLFDDCDCNGAADDQEIAAGAARDTNGNGLPDRCELDCGTSDCDEDGVPDTADNCILLSNPDQPDEDGDGVGHDCDNCLGLANAPQIDTDADGHGDACDNCAIAANPEQLPAVLSPLVLARRSDQFCWSPPTRVASVRGPLAQVASYVADPVQTHAHGLCYLDDQIPASGAGFYYLFRPDCPAASWQSSIGTEPDRDPALDPGAQPAKVDRAPSSGRPGSR